MKLFISWSGEKSELIALELKDWLSSMFPSVQVWISKRDIAIGAQWYSTLINALKDTNFGILCLTKENLNSGWLLFEAGAILKAVDENRIVPLLIDLTAKELKGPLSFFQALSLNKIEMHNLVTVLNKISDSNFREPQVLDALFERLWPSFNEKVQELNKISYPRNKNDFTIIYSRDLSILLLLKEGKTLREAGKELGLSPKTVQGYVGRLTEKLGARNIRETIEFAVYYELI